MFHRRGGEAAASGLLSLPLLVWNLYMLASVRAIRAFIVSVDHTQSRASLLCVGTDRIWEPPPLEHIHQEFNLYSG